MKTSYLGLLRGINVGGKNKLPMKELKDLVTELGVENVTTYIQSGNVVMRAEPGLEAILEERIESRILERFGLKVPLILRTLEEVERVVVGNPFLKAGIDESTLFVMFLKHLPATDRVESLDPDRSPGDSYEVVGREIFMRLPNKVADSKLTNAYFDSKLATISTARNWRTVKTLLDLLKKAE